MFITNDLGLSAYLMIHGLSLKDASVNARGVYIFEFEDPNSEAKKLSIKFLNSECARYDQQVRNLRTLLKSSGNSHSS
jgi:hypothetical protein